tara:strand:- start:1557 stop:2726 length:1170 start_codon:yes stop_codon:yes gene_type:complete
MKNITLVIPSFNNKEHLINSYESIRRYYKDAELVIINDGSVDGTYEWLEDLADPNVIKINSKERKGHTYFYDEGIKVSTNEIVGILHADMVIGPNYIENMVKHLERGKVVCATRIEPPIHPGGKEKIVKDFGMDYHDLKFKEFESFVLSEQEIQKDKTTKGIFAPWVLYREDHFKIGGHDQKFAPYGYEDSDIFNRWILAGYEMIQSRDAFVYHLTCRGHRWNEGVGIENPDYKEQMERCRKDFIRKWGDWIQNDEYQFPIIHPKYNIGIRLENGNLILLEALEPWCDRIYTEELFGTIGRSQDYVENEESKFDLSKRVHSLTDNDRYDYDDIVIEINGHEFGQNDFKNITIMSHILNDSDLEKGSFELGNLKITINNIQTYEHELIKI